MNIRVEEAVAALERGDARALGPILAAGARAARPTGGGFGGSIVTLAPVDRCAEIAAAVVAAYLAATGRCHPADRHPRRRRRPPSLISGRHA